VAALKRGSQEYFGHLRRAATPYKSGNALITSPEVAQAQSELAALYKLFPDLKDQDAG
jgi:hypothetical protein